MSTETKTPKTKTEPHACACAGWTAVLPGLPDLKGTPKAHRAAAEHDEATNQTTISIQCAGLTKATFAPGHDARFKGLAITAARFGGSMAKEQGGLLVDMSPWDAVGSVAPALVAHLPARPAPAEKPTPKARRAKATPTA